MKISRRRFSQLLSGLLVAPLVKSVEASPEPQPKPEAPPALFKPFTQIEGGPPARISVASEDAATDQPLYVYGGFYP